MASLFTADTLPTTSEQALREFDERYLVALTSGQPGEWAGRFTESIASPRVTYPMSFATAKFRETKALAGTFEDMAEDDFDLKVVEYDAGHEAPALDLFSNVFAYRRWAQAPGEIVLAEQWHVADQLAALLETGTTANSPFDGVAFFSASHLANPKDAASATFSNYNAAALDPASVANLTAQMIIMRGVLDMNGKKLGVNPDEIWVPTEKGQHVANLLAQANLASGESNPMFGKLRVVEIPQLTDANDWYLVDSGLMARGLAPLIAAKYQAPDSLGMRTWDESSDYFKDSGRIKKSVHVWYGFGLVFPHAIRLVRGA